MSEEKPYKLSPYILLIAGMGLFVISNGRWTVPFAAWLAPVFLMRFSRSQKPASGLLILFLLIAIASGIMLYGIVPALLGVLTYILLIYYAILWFIPYLADRLFATRLKGFGSTLVFPATLVSVEFVNNLFYGSWASVAYTQFDNLPLIQISSIFGMWGVSFLVMWFASVVNWILENELRWLVVKRGALIYFGILFLVLLYGGFRQAVFTPDSQNVVIASFTPYPELEEYGKEIEKRGYSSSLEMAIVRLQRIWTQRPLN